MIELRVRKFGNSLGLVLPKEVVARLNTGVGQRLHLADASDGGYRLIPYDPSFGAKMAKAEDIIGRFPNTLRVLGE